MSKDIQSHRETLFQKKQQTKQAPPPLTNKQTNPNLRQTYLLQEARAGHVEAVHVPACRKKRKARKGNTEKGSNRKKSRQTETPSGRPWNQLVSTSELTCVPCSHSTVSPEPPRRPPHIPFSPEPPTTGLYTSRSLTKAFHKILVKKKSVFTC